jgi:hypothetical protein
VDRGQPLKLPAKSRYSLDWPSLKFGFEFASPDFLLVFLFSFFYFLNFRYFGGIHWGKDFYTLRYISRTD